MKGPGKFEPRRRARRRALQALYQWHMTQQPPAEIIAQFREEQDFDNVDEAFFAGLVHGVAEGRETWGERLQPFLDRPWSQLDLIEKIVLSLGAFELANHEESPARVVLDECIELARRFGAEQGHRFVNGVLDRATKAWRPAEPRESGSSD